jgi:hypothetical protein
VTGYFARYKQNPLRRARLADLSAAETADRTVHEIGHSAEGKLLLSYIEANRVRIGEAALNAVQSRSDPYAAVAEWVDEHEIEAYDKIRDALRQGKGPPL